MVCLLCEPVIDRVRRAARGSCVFRRSLTCRKLPTTAHRCIQNRSRITSISHSGARWLLYRSATAPRGLAKPSRAFSSGQSANRERDLRSARNGPCTCPPPGSPSWERLPRNVMDLSPDRNPGLWCRLRGQPSRRPSGLRKTKSRVNSLAHRTTWLRSDFPVLARRRALPPGNAFPGTSWT